MNCNNIRNEFPILHNGTSQEGRPPFALNSDYVKVDERSDADWIVFARTYSKFLQFYNLNNLPEGNWSPFWTRNPAIVLANIAAARVDWFREETRLMAVEIQKLENAGNESLLRQNFSKLFDAVATLAWQLDTHIERLPEGLPIRVSLKNLIQKKLAPAFQKWMLWHMAANAVPLIDTGDSFLQPRVRDMRILGEPLQSAATIWNNNTFSADWITDGAATTWADYLTILASITDNSIFNGATVVENINFAIGHAFFKNTYEAFLQGFAKAVQEAKAALGSLMRNYDRHEPHFALYLAFIRLLKHERDYLNLFTDRHLRFYYERVLNFRPRPPVPSQAHVFFELAKHVDSHLLKKGALFKAGKDAAGNNMFFSLDRDFVANKAKVVDFKCILKVPDDPELYQSAAYKVTDRNRYYAAPAANTADGMGAALTTTAGEWHPFGNKALNNGNEWEIAIPPAQVGFAIASNYLYLREGNRTITLTFNGVGEAINDKVFKVELTTEKGWIELEQGVTVSNRQMVITLAGDAPAILPYQQKIHGGAYSTEFPMLKATLVNGAEVEYEYEAIKNLEFSGANPGITLHVNVVNKQALALSGSSGPLDNSKPFHPFGAAPENGAVFYVGDKEVFQKRSNVTLIFSWKETLLGEPDDHGEPESSLETLLLPVPEEEDDNSLEEFDPRVAAFLLRDRRWGNPENEEVILPRNATSRNYIFTVPENGMIDPDFSDNEIYSIQKANGYLKFILVGDFGHRQYPFEFAKFIAVANVNRFPEPDPPFDPQILSIQLTYYADTLIPLNDKNSYLSQSGRFFHLHPFGFKEIVPGSSATRLLPEMVPQSSVPPSTVGKDGGEWYIGVEGLEPPQNLAVLIQVFEGSANPLLEKPVPHVQWSYLVDNTWIDFEENEVGDGTYGLLQSGIVTFSVPREANTDNTILPAGKHWIRVSVQSAVDAVCKVIGVHAQAAGVTLSDEGNQLQIESYPLAPGTIQKLFLPDSAIKKVQQPYATFGGRPLETSASFYTRASERLRHKNRSAALWDYERMVLEQFSFAHKVKCLNHLQFQTNGDNYIYRELAPGHVTVIVIPNSRNQATANPLRPFTSLGDLKKIEAFLKEHTSCFVNLHVRNPLFEEVRARFKVRLFDGYDEDFYLTLLNEEIVQFLSPWAFDNKTEIGFGGQIYKSELINFVEERPYVDYLIDFELIHLTKPPQPDQEVARASKLVSILVSAAQHDITPIHDAARNEQQEDCRCELNGKRMGKGEN